MSFFITKMGHVNEDAGKVSRFYIYSYFWFVFENAACLETTDQESILGLGIATLVSQSA